ncbi:glucose-6-phosphate isomerase [Comamonas serinivorans]|uniref:Glucose-6-phosphate isomerase n=1 Tax=Comamonas serinivorans TaxID=1082851 RepID=A0A1Y0EU63_9BURK|nr:glucose-6-phosphate isomerase [Comamonas serinivorans]ARU06949.1 glucose-6-phosphate isomerase [Comamonas serinivorans]
MTERVPCNQVPAWAALAAHHAQLAQGFDLCAAFTQDAGRVARMGVQAPQVYADLSKHLVDDRALALLVELAEQRGLPAQREAMFSGAAVNVTEGRAALHSLLRVPPDAAHEVPTHLQDKLAQVHDGLNEMLALAEAVRANPQITDVVNIGIGGSDLGPHMTVQALEGWRPAAGCQTRKRLHFVSNVDGMELGALLEHLQPANTRFLIASKTFTTAETMVNARAARDWFLQHPDTQAQGLALADHFLALTANVAEAQAFGVQTILGFWDWVGGRFSLWSAIGLPIAIAIGAAGFRELLAGAHAMDRHFRDAPLAHNLPVRLGLLDIWYRNFHGLGSRCIAPYSHNLRRLPAYLQQLEMESNGKGVDVDGRPLDWATSPVIWGEPGTNGQHAFFEMVHQGPDVIPVEFIAARTPGPFLPRQHRNLVANALAQARALMMGVQHENPHRACSGNRPSSFLLLDALDPASLGALIALYEHRVFVSAAIWGINPFDQWGVELGKQIAKDVTPRLATGDVAGLDASTADLIARLRG